jgi:hypothetical protein
MDHVVRGGTSPLAAEPEVRRLSGPGIGWGGMSRLERGVVVAIVLAVAALGAFSLVGDLLRPAPDIVAASRSALAHPPALEARVRLAWDATIRVAHDGHGTWRRDYPSSVAAYSFDLWSADRFAFYDADLRAWVETDPGTRRIHLPTWGDAACPEPVRLADEDVAGRGAYRIRCPEGDFWVDRESLLILRETGTVAGMPYLDEIVDLSLEPRFGASTFRFAPPAGARAMTLAEYRTIVFPSGEAG